MSKVACPMAPDGARRALLLSTLVLAPVLAGCTGPAPPGPSQDNRACDAPLLTGAESGSDDGLPAPERLTVETSDGAALVVTRWPGDPMHVALLVHDHGGDHADWTDFAVALQRQGFTVGAFDLRGHGDSTSRDGQDYRHTDFAAEDYTRMAADVAAVAGLVEGPGGGCLAVVGAGLGANVALQAMVTGLSQAHAGALLSPSVEAHNVTTLDAIGQFGDRPLFLAAARGDVVAAQTAQRLASEAEDATVELVGGEAHGLALLGAESDGTTVGARLRAWLHRLV